MNGYKNKICKYAANKRLISDLKIQIEMRAWKKLFHANGSQKKAGVEILISIIRGYNKYKYYRSIISIISKYKYYKYYYKYYKYYKR